MILLYSSRVGYDRHAIISLGRGISIYGGLFLLQLQLIINYIKSLFKIGFSDHTSCGPALWTTMGLFLYSTSQGLLISKILVLSKNWFNKLIEEIVLLLKLKPCHDSVVWCGVAPPTKKEEGLIFNLNSNSKSAAGSDESSSGQAVFPEGCPVFENRASNFALAK